MSEYSATLDYLFSKFPMYQNVGGAAYKAGLGPITSLLNSLDNPQEEFKSIHVAGTNGKGSVSHMLAAVLIAHGYKVGLYTSPHLLDFRERIKINGEPIAESEVIDFVRAHKATFEKVSPSFFEWSVALAFNHFAKEQVDIAIVEVGMGGRLDATNVIVPLVSVITNIGLDHKQFLGDTHEKIAREKAGIIKKGVPVIIGETRSDTLLVFKEFAAKESAPLYLAEEFSCPYSTDLKGSYQQKNLRTVTATLQNLPEFSLDEDKVKAGLNSVVSSTGLMGRWQQLSDAPLFIADVGHNKEGLSYNMEQLKKEAQGHCHLLLGFVNDKDLTSVIELLPKEWKYIAAEANNRRAIPQKELKKLLEDAGLMCMNIEGAISDQLKVLLATILPTDTLYIGGSTFVVAEALDFFQ
jgi:dihydrofolate synthase/folylpolyglutamate synthase